MDKVLFTGFKGKNNASRILAEQTGCDYILLTNSFAGIKKDIDKISEEYGYVMMFGVDKELGTTVRIERSAAVNGEKLVSCLDLEKLAGTISAAGIKAVISDAPKLSLCNDAYWHMLRKYNGRAVFIHIPTVKYADRIFIDKLRSALPYTTR